VRLASGSAAGNCFVSQVFLATNEFGPVQTNAVIIKHHAICTGHADVVAVNGA